MLQLLVVLVVTSPSTTVEVTEGLESVFFDKGAGALLYISLALSYFSLIKTRRVDFEHVYMQYTVCKFRPLLSRKRT